MHYIYHDVYTYHYIEIFWLEMIILINSLPELIRLIIN